MPADPQRVIADLLELRNLTSVVPDDPPPAMPGGVLDGRPPLASARLAWTEPWARGRAWLLESLSDLNLDVETDPAGNLWATLRGERPQRVVIGSHLDSVPNGGWLDGALGVVAGAEVLRGLHRDRVELPISVSLVDWADEEGARFGRSLFGSAAVAGSLDVEAVANLADNDGVRLSDAVQAWGVDLDRIRDAGDVLGLIAASAELHIEQGPVLESKRRHLAAVSGIRGVERFLVRLRGQACHAGATPIAMRRDPTIAAARIAMATRDLGRELDAFATVGVWRVRPGVATAVNGHVEFSVDLRHLDRVMLDRLARRFREIVDAIAEEEHVSAETEQLWSIDPVDFDTSLVALASDVVERRSGIREAMPSGPMHDSAELARAGVPTVMLFVPSLGGLSHTVVEDTTRSDLELGVAAYDDLVRLMLGRMSQ